MEGQASGQEGLSIWTIHHRGAGHEKDVSVSGGSRQELDGSGFQPMCSLWSPGTLRFSSLQPSGAQQKWAGHRVEPEGLGLRWKEGVRMMKSYRTYHTPTPMEKTVASLETPDWRQGLGP